MIGPDEVHQRRIAVDGFNVLVSVEAAMSGGVVLCGRDRCYRDMASMHGSYRKVSETDPAVNIIGQVLATAKPASVIWLLDRPVSNSGRLAALIRNTAVRNRWPWSVELADNPDSDLKRFEDVVATADGEILNDVNVWFNLARQVISNAVPNAWIVDLSEWECDDYSESGS